MTESASTGWKARARKLKALIHALLTAYRDPRTPLPAKLVAACVLGYAFSPIDLIPDFIPLLGYVDDLVLVPLGIALAIRLIPPEVWADARAEAGSTSPDASTAGRIAASVIVVLWLVVAVAAVLLLRHRI